MVISGCGVEKAGTCLGNIKPGVRWQQSGMVVRSRRAIGNQSSYSGVISLFLIFFTFYKVIHGAII